MFPVSHFRVKFLSYLAVVAVVIAVGIINNYLHQRLQTSQKYKYLGKWSLG